VSILSTTHDESTTEVPGSREAHGKQKHYSVWGYKLDHNVLVTSQKLYQLVAETVHFLDLTKANNDTSHCQILKQTLKVESFFKNCVRQANKKIKLQRKHQ